jgi:beta-lactam-binding protein with PASTA domain
MNKYLWIVPFACFLSGYGIMSIIYKTKTTQAPALVGKTIQEALRITAQNGLSIILIKEQEDAELPAGTIILQNPQPNTHIKSHQAIQCVISKRTEQYAPQLIGKNINDCTPELDTLRIKYKIHAIANSAPEGMCIAQDPAPTAQMANKTLTLYIANNTLQQYLFPNLRQRSIEDVKNFLASAPVVIQVSHAFEQPEGHTCSECIVSDQRPRPGTIVSLNKATPIQVQLIATPVVNSNE